MGRPSAFTDEVKEKILEGASMGFNNTEVALHADIAESTLYKYLSENPKFSERFEKLKSNPNLMAKKTIYKNLHDEKTAKWQLERRAKAEYGQNIDITSKGEKLPAPILGGITNEQEGTTGDQEQEG